MDRILFNEPVEPSFSIRRKVTVNLILPYGFAGDPGAALPFESLHEATRLIYLVPRNQS
jgi:hypothetical protein